MSYPPWPTNRMYLFCICISVCKIAVSIVSLLFSVLIFYTFPICIISPLTYFLELIRPFFLFFCLSSYLHQCCPSCIATYHDIYSLSTVEFLYSLDGGIKHYDTNMFEEAQYFRPLSRCSRGYREYLLVLRIFVGYLSVPTERDSRPRG
jgi:hypothetical protein